MRLRLRLLSFGTDLVELDNPLLVVKEWTSGTQVYSNGNNGNSYSFIERNMHCIVCRMNAREKALSEQKLFVKWMKVSVV